MLLYEEFIYRIFLSGISFGYKGKRTRSLWKIQAVDYQGTYYGAAVANGGIGILPWKEPFSVRHVMLNHVFVLPLPKM